MDYITTRGKPFRDQAGNVRMQYLMKSYLDGYDHATKQEKIKIAWKVVHQTKAHSFFAILTLPLAFAEVPMLHTVDRVVSQPSCKCLKSFVIKTHAGALSSHQQYGATPMC
jgi:hypothetical protein